MHMSQRHHRTAKKESLHTITACEGESESKNSKRKDGEVDLAWAIIRKAIFDLGCWCKHCAHRTRACRCDGIRRNALAFLQDRPWDNKGELIPSGLEFWCHIAQIPAQLIREFFSDANVETWIQLTIDYRAPYRRARKGRSVPAEANKLDLWSAFGQSKATLRPGLQITMGQPQGTGPAQQSE